MLVEKCRELDIPTASYEALKAGADYVGPDGNVVKNELVTEEGPKSLKYAYCADTLFTDSYMDIIKGADTIYHECTYLEADAEKAFHRFHSTAGQAAQIAQMAGCNQLLLGHFSSKYKELEKFEEEAREIFVNSQIAVEGFTYDI